MIRHLPSLLSIVIVFSGSIAHAKPDPEPQWDPTASGDWPAPFEKIEIPASSDGTAQPAYGFRSTSRKPMPLVVSLHTWGGSYSQRDPLAAPVQAKNWNYIHPHFRGANRTPEACGSPEAVQDIDDAISHALQHFPVDRSLVFVVGVSGGGHAACLNYLATQHRIATTFAWVPITNLEAWYHESRSRRNRYAADILAATQSVGGTLNVGEARRRSPLYAPLPSGKASPIRLFAGINDGYIGSVPVSHSLLFYNRLAQAWGTPGDPVADTDLVALLARGRPAGAGPDRKIGSKEVLYHKAFPLASVTIFQGAHEMLVEYCLEAMEKIVANGRHAAPLTD